MTPRIAISLYRVAQKFPPSLAEYRSHQARGRILPEGATERERRSWDALSAWDTEAGARQVAETFRSAKWIVRFDIPESAAGVHWEQSPPEGHYDLRGDMEELARYLAPDFRVGA